MNVKYSTTENYRVLFFVSSLPFASSAMRWSLDRALDKGHATMWYQLVSFPGQQFSKSRHKFLLFANNTFGGNKNSSLKKEEGQGSRSDQKLITKEMVLINYYN